jgi:hypothetical protein
MEQYTYMHLVYALLEWKLGLCVYVQVASAGGCWCRRSSSILPHRQEFQQGAMVATTTTTAATYNDVYKFSSSADKSPEMNFHAERIAAESVETDANYSAE